MPAQTHTKIAEHSEPRGGVSINACASKTAAFAPSQPPETDANEEKEQP